MTKLRRILLPAFALPFAAIALHAQSSPSTTPSAGPQGDETVKLSEFTVSAAPTHGYSASETMTGSRVNTKIIDLPYSVVNITSEFFKDFGLNILDDDLTYIGGFTDLNIGGSFTLRGFSSTSQLRDGFYRLGRYGGSNVDRIEIIRGPNAAIYGRTSPGGMVNMISLQPKKANTQSLYLLNGSYDQRQEQFEATGSINAKTYYVVSLDQTERRYDGQFTHIRNTEDYVGVRHDFSDTSHLTASAEYFLQIQHAPQQSAQVMSVTRTATPDNSATTHAIGYDTALTEYNPYGNHSELNRGESFFNIEYDKEFNDVWSLRTAGNYFRARRWDFNQNTGWGGFTIPAAGAPVVDARGATPNKGRIMEDGGGIQSDLLAHYFIFNHSIENKSLLTVDYNDYYRWDPTLNIGPDAALTAWNTQRNVTLIPIVNKNGETNYVPNTGQALAYFPEDFHFGNEGLNTLTRRRTTSLGGNLRQQMFFFDGHLITFAGVRYDAVRFSQRDYTVQFPSVGFNPTHPAGTAGASVVRRYFHQTRPNLGFNYKVTPNIHLYGSYSESYFVDQTNRPVAIAGTAAAPFSPETAKGVDYGIKGAFFNEKLNFTLGGYYINRYNVSVSDDVVDALGNHTSVTRLDGNQNDKGVEFDASWLPNDNLSFTLSGAIVNAKYTNFGSKFPEAKGRSVNGVTPENGSFIVKYTYTQGPLKGLDIEGLVTYVSSSPKESPTAGDTTTLVNGVQTVTGHTDQWKLRIPSFTLWDFSANYKLPWQWAHLQQTVGLHIKNAFNKYYLKTSRNLGDSRSIIISYEISH